jgi:hypothetical protein
MKSVIGPWGIWICLTPMLFTTFPLSHGMHLLYLFSLTRSNRTLSYLHIYPSTQVPIYWTQNVSTRTDTIQEVMKVLTVQDVPFPLLYLNSSLAR